MRAAEIDTMLFSASEKFRNAPAGEKAGRAFVYGEMDCCHASGLSVSVLSQKFRR
jgi:hypothetical protein